MEKPSINTLLEKVEDTKFHRKIASNIRKFNIKLQDQNEQGSNQSFYTKSELEALESANVQDRLPPRATEHYMDLAQKSCAIRNLIKARPEETNDLSGEADPSNQLRYSPVSGLLHKYELILVYVVRACSSWCRYCYRSDFLTNKTDKDIADVDEVSAYIQKHNKEAKLFNQFKLEGEPHRPLIRETLLSGGDPMVLSNRNLLKWFHGLAEAGLQTIRIGTKELAFFPYRFDDNFFNMLDLFHETHPEVNLAFMVHFTHPDEILEIDDATGEYIRKENGHYKRIEVTEKAISRLRGRSYVTLENQTPIIDSVNDNSDALRLLQIELKRLGINNHYYFQCREIEGHKVFAVPVEKAWKIHQDSQQGTSGIEKSRFVMSTEAGKLEVVSVIDKPDLSKFSVPPTLASAIEQLIGNGLVIMKFHRSPKLEQQGDLIIARRNPEALWMTGYEDRIIYDGRLGAGNQYNPLGTLIEGLLAENKEELLVSNA